MSSRVATFKSGGGYLNEVDVTISGYRFEAGDTVQIKKGDRKGEDFTPLSLVVQFTPDDAADDADPLERRMLIGDAANFGEISEDGLTLGTPEGQSIPAKSEAGIWLKTLVNPTDGGDGFPDERFPEDEETMNFEAMIGTRVHSVMEINPNKPKQKGKKGTKNEGKEFAARDLKVATVHSLPDEDAAPAKSSKGSDKKSGGKPANKGDDKKAAKNKIAEKAVDTLKGILAKEKNNTILKSKLSMAVLKALTKDGDREAVREWLFDDDNLEGIDGVTYNAKKGSIVLNEEDEDGDDEE